MSAHIESESPAIKKHILFVLCLNVVMGGAEISMLALMKGLQKKGYRVTLVVFGCLDNLADYIGPDIEVVRIKAKRTLATFIPLCALIRKTRPSVLIAALTSTNVISIAAAAMARRGTRIIATEHGQVSLDTNFATGFKSRLLSRVARLLYVYTDEIVAVSKGLAEFIEKTVPRHRRHPVRVIYNPVIPADHSLREAITPHKWLNEDVPLIVGIGRLEKEKNFSLLLHAAALVLKKRAIRVVILGEGNQKAALQALAEKLHIKEHVLFPGFVHNVNDWLSHASVFVCSSLCEGFGNVIVEAMAYGLTVVSTNCPFGPEEILDGGRYGHLIPMNDPESMASAILQALEHPMDKDSIKNRAASYTDVKCFDAYDQLISSL